MMRALQSADMALETIPQGISESMLVALLLATETFCEDTLGQASHLSET
jgi:hypothetical protein